MNESKLAALRVEKEAEARLMGLDPAACSIVISANDDFETTGMSKARYKGNFAALVPPCRNETGGLLSQLTLTLGARIQLKRNLNVCIPYFLSQPVLIQVTSLGWGRVGERVPGPARGLA